MFLISWYFALLLFVSGTLLGWLLFYCKHRRQANKQNTLQTKLAQAEQNLNQYKDKVTGHLTKTAEILGTMASSYQLMIDHLKNDGQHLCQDNSDIHPLLGQLSTPISTPEDTSPLTQQKTPDTAGQNASLPDQDDLTGQTEPKDYPIDLQDTQPEQEKPIDHFVTH